MDLPVVILTACADTSTGVSSLHDGTVIVLDKPFRNDELRSYLQEELQKCETDCRRQRHRESWELRLKRLAPQDRGVLQLTLDAIKNRMNAKRFFGSRRAPSGLEHGPIPLIC